MPTIRRWKRSTLYTAIVAISLLLAPVTWGGTIYELVDSAGRTVYTDRPDRFPNHTNLTLYASLPKKFSIRSTRISKPKRVPVTRYKKVPAIDQMIQRTARNNRLDPTLLRALVHAESSFNPNAISPRGAEGLTQLMPDTARYYGVHDSFDPQQNLNAGARHLKILLQRFNGNETLALAAYNAGESAVNRYGGVPPYAETRTYIQRVQSLRHAYRH